MIVLALLVGLLGYGVAFDLGTRLGRRVGRVEGFQQRFCPNCLKGWVNQ